MNTTDPADSVDQLFSEARRNRQQAEETYREIERALKGKA